MSATVSSSIISITRLIMNFSAGFAKTYGGANDKILMMPGPTWYAGGGSTSFLASLGIPAGEITAALPLRWNKDPLTTGQVGGGPSTRQEPLADRSGGRLQGRHEVAT